MADFYYDDRRLMSMFEELEPRRRVQAMRGALRLAANELRKKAVENLRSSKLNSNRDVEKGIRSVVWKRSLGFRVTIGTKKKRAKNESKARARRAIVPLWAEGGTDERHTGRSSFSGRGRRTGKMPAFRFMEATKESMTDVETTVKEKIVANIEKTSLKYGGKFTK